MYAGVGSTIVDPGALKCATVARNAAITSATGRTRAGSTVQPYRSAAQPA
jgi:hypothetical protein